MKRIIFKHELKFNNLNKRASLLLQSCDILDVQLQNNKFILWESHVVSDYPYLTERTFIVAATGIEFEAEPFCHIATIQEANGFVWHIFEVLTYK